MNTSRRAVLAAMASVPLAGCARARDPNTLSLWAMSYEGDYAPVLIPPFTRATGLQVDVQSLPWTAAHEKLLTAHAGEALPDVLMLPAGWVGEFAMIGAIAPVPEPALIQAVLPSLRDGTRIGGRAWSVPWATGPQAQFYRTDILVDAGYDAPPGDWEGWRQMGRAIKRRRPDDFAFLMLLNWWDALFTFFGQVGGVPLKDRGTRGDFRAPQYEAALAYYVSLYDEGLAPRALSSEVQDPVAAFASGYFAVYPYGPALLLDLGRRADIIPRERWATARMPGPRGPAQVSAIGATLAVSSTCTRPDAAWALVRHLTSAESELEFQRRIGNLPANAAAWKSPQLATSVLAPFASQLADPIPDPQIVEYERIRLEVQIVAERAVRHLITIPEALAEMDRRADAILAKRRALLDAGRLA